MSAAVSIKVSLEGPYYRTGTFGWISDASIVEAWADTANSPMSSPLLLLEDGRPLGPAHTSHASIREHGRGRFSAWNNGTATSLYFSTSDGSDPNVNGRRYELALELTKERVLVRPRSGTSTGYSYPDFKRLGAEGWKNAIDEFFDAIEDKNHSSRDDFYHGEEYLLKKLITYLGQVQGGSVRHVNIADQYVRAAQRHLPTLKGTTVAEIGPGNNLGTGIIFRYLGSERYHGIELYTGPEFNAFSTLSTIETLTRFKYGEFLDNFNNVALGFVPQKPLDFSVDLSSSGVNLLKQDSLSRISLPDGSVDYLFSNFVFEHIQEPDAMIGQIARVLRPGGITAHFIDIEDHSNFQRPHTYLKFTEEEWNSRYAHAGGDIPSHFYENRLRASDFKKAFEGAGLEVVEFSPLRRHSLTSQEISEFDERWRCYEKADLETVWLFLVARKPASPAIGGGRRTP